MNIRSYFSTGSQTAIERIDELTRVTLLRDFATGAGVLPKAARGTVVSVYDDGAAYCVEFSRPFEALVTVPSSDLVAEVDQLERPSAPSPDLPHRD